MIRQFVRDVVELTRVHSSGDVSGAAMKRALLEDSVMVVAITRLRAGARQMHLGPVNRMLRIAQTALYGVEIGKDVTLGDGVYFVHTVGTVIGGNARIGNRVQFMGNNTVGTAKNNGYPTIGDDVVVGAGARILGPVTIGARAVIGANAVVLIDVPEGATATGIPAQIRLPAPQSERIKRAGE